MDEPRSRIHNRAGPAFCSAATLGSNFPNLRLSRRLLQQETCETKHIHKTRFHKSIPFMPSSPNFAHDVRTGRGRVLGAVGGGSPEGEKLFQRHQIELRVTVSQCGGTTRGWLWKTPAIKH